MLEQIGDRVLKEMVYNPKIGEQFNSVGSESARQKWDVQRMLVLPDENLGREIMQVSSFCSFRFTISILNSLYPLIKTRLYPPQAFHAWYA